MTQPIAYPAWLEELTQQVQNHLDQLGRERSQLRPALEAEQLALNKEVQGYLQTLGNPSISVVVRGSVEAKLEAALTRLQAIETELTQEDARAYQIKRLVSPAEVCERLKRLPEVLAENHPTRGNLELACHIDRIDCFADGNVVMRTCKLGSLPDAIDLLASANMAASDSTVAPVKSRQRRRAKLRVDELDETAEALDSQAYMVADTNRFAGLSEEWFWSDVFQLPKAPRSWAARNAETVFGRLQETRDSRDKLASHFKVSRPTISAAIRHYVDAHPEAREELRRASRARGPTVDVAPFADEARQRYEALEKKAAIGRRYKCSVAVIERALALAYDRDGLPVPSANDLRLRCIAQARAIYDAHGSLDAVFTALDISDVTARTYLTESLEAEGRRLPDLRTRRERERRKLRSVLPRPTRVSERSSVK